MSRRRSRELKALLDEILTDANGDEEQLWVLRQALDDNVKVPCAAMITGEPVKVTKFDTTATPAADSPPQSAGQMDPADEYSGEPGDPVEAWAKKIIKRGEDPGSRWSR